MIATFCLSHTSSEGMDEELNEVLEELQKDGHEVVDIKFNHCFFRRSDSEDDNSVEQEFSFSALIIYKTVDSL